MAVNYLCRGYYSCVMARYWLSCIDCGIRVRRNWKPGRPHKCVPCAIAGARTVAIQMHKKEGAAWAKWQQNGGAAGRPPVSKADVTELPRRIA